MYYLGKDAPKQHPDSEFFRYFSASGKNIYLNFEVRYGKVLNIDVVIVSMILVIYVSDLFNFMLNSEGYITPIWWCIL